MECRVSNDESADERARGIEWLLTPQVFDAVLRDLELVLQFPDAYALAGHGCVHILRFLTQGNADKTGTSSIFGTLRELDVGLIWGRPL
jgi:hypothetical protein